MFNSRMFHYNKIWFYPKLKCFEWKHSIRNFDFNNKANSSNSNNNSNTYNNTTNYGNSKLVSKLYFMRRTTLVRYINYNTGDIWTTVQVNR